MAKELEAIKIAITSVLEDFGEAKARIRLKEYSGKGKLIVAFNSYILPELCIKLLKVLPSSGEFDERGIAEQIIELHKKLGTTYKQGWPPREMMFHERLRELLEEDDILGVFYDGLTYQNDAKAYELVRDLDDGYMVYIVNDWVGLDEVMEACILGVTARGRISLIAVFWYPIIGLIRISAINSRDKLMEGRTKKVIGEVLEPMRRIILEHIEYEKKAKRRRRIRGNRRA